MQYSIELSQIPNQEFTVELDGVLFRIEFITRNDNLYANKIYVENELKACGIACLNKYNILSLVNTNIKGFLYFKDVQGNENPKYTGFNDRWLLIYEV